MCLTAPHPFRPCTGRASVRSYPSSYIQALICQKVIDLKESGRPKGALQSRAIVRRPVDISANGRWLVFAKRLSQRQMACVCEETKSLQSLHPYMAVGVAPWSSSSNSRIRSSGRIPAATLPKITNDVCNHAAISQNIRSPDITSELRSTTVSHCNSRLFYAVVLCCV